MSGQATDHPLPWRTSWTRFGESMGCDSKAQIVDAKGRPVVSLGDGTSSGRARCERLAQLIVDAVNARGVAP